MNRDTGPNAEIALGCLRSPATATATVQAGDQPAAPPQAACEPELDIRARRSVATAAHVHRSIFE